MGRAYAQDRRERVMAEVDAGTGAYAVAAIVRLSVSDLDKVPERRKRTGETSARPWAGGPQPKLAAYDEALRTPSKPDATLSELQAWLIAEHNVKASSGGLWKRLRQLGLTRKKKSLRTAEQDRAGVAKARDEWRASEPGLNPERLVFIDESVLQSMDLRCKSGEPSPMKDRGGGYEREQTKAFHG